jgi:hypothetical protein
MLASEKGYLNTAECAVYLASFDHYLALRNEFEEMKGRFMRGEILSQDECEL